MPSYTELPRRKGILTIMPRQPTHDLLRESLARTPRARRAIQPTAVLGDPAVEETRKAIGAGPRPMPRSFATDG